MRLRRFCALLVVLLSLIFINVYALPQVNPDTVKSSIAKQDTSSMQRGKTANLDLGKRAFSTETLKDLIGLCGSIGYLLGLTLILGVVFLIQQCLVLIREKNDGKKIPVNDIKTMSYDDIEKMFTQIREENPFSADEENRQMKELPLLKRLFRKKKASAFRLLHKLFLIFDSKKSTNSFNDETANYIQYLKDSFNPFLTRLAFLSDTSGALGLLGTVWGMYLVFSRGNPTPEETIYGMGVALATTIVGLVISIFLNSFTTVVSNLFDRHLDFISKMANVFQERMMNDEELQPVTAQPVYLDSSALSSLPKTKDIPRKKEIKETVRTEEEQPLPAPKKAAFGPPAEIKIVAGDNQTAEVNSPLPEPIVAEILDSRGNPLENLAVIFAAEDGAGMFSNDNRVQKVLTNDEGKAQVNLTLGKIAGEKSIRISLEDNNSKVVTLLAIAKPTPPTRMIEIDGNFQMGQLGKRLDRPFIIGIKDKYNNPITRHEIIFNLAKGSGKFQDSQNAHLSAFTNEEGLVEVYFVVGNERGSRDIEIESKKVDPGKIKFEVFAV